MEWYFGVLNICVDLVQFLIFIRFETKPFFHIKTINPVSKCPNYLWILTKTKYCYYCVGNLLSNVSRYGTQ